MERFIKDGNTIVDSKYTWTKRILVLILIILLVRLWDLQIMRGSEMKRLSEQNRIRIKKVVAPRGVIYDRKGRILADTRPSFNIYITHEDIKNFDQTIDGLVSLLNISKEEIMERLEAAKGLPPSFPVKIKSDISMDDVAKIEANRVYLPGVNIQIEPKRFYHYGKMFAHMIGYVSEISDDELKKKEYKDYSPGDYIGKYGLEKAYEAYLRGIDGEKRVEVDSRGREVRTLEQKDPVPGNSIYLNVDLDIQAVIDKALENRRGGCIVVDPKTGGVIALVSRPAFDPNKFASGITKQDWQAIALDKAHPLQNRVIQGRYPPGSTFKIVSALKGLELGMINERTTFSCRGGFPYGGRVFRCWKKGGHGSVSIHRAIVESCDVFFYNLGLRLGVDRIHEMSDIIGLGRVTGIDLPGEKDGLVPSTEWKKKTYGQPWFEGETVSVSIGQGAVWLTPAQLVQLASFVANEGINYKPHIVNRIVSPEGKVLKTFEPVINANVKLKKDTIRLVKEGMKGVVNEGSGTAYGSRLENVSMSGKTGTAQSVGEKGRNLGDHAWFIAYAPSDNPSVAISVLVEYGGHGSSAAAPVAKMVTDRMFNEKKEIKEARLNENR
ncbi:MAG TPA: penicillin-binding protein 2 [Syntrophorhabdaceae bacterium]|nr:penicillin-binding protein 2 [Syntrophorhabdaceae bacterium]HOT41883.1 penicillin-binding protein 2 [Syntrophorhabdaceae bacterium]HPC66435.1 penicillin-binding protein 2 [Syntrophorhabdaceae bacterium]HQE79819.1 penicillin-binding protein 2 [Syntrophorhabdaceae bacterium]HQH43284.1 penicillin-binding protein 2 [Syntrophorhabdaceae bacterium]